MPAPEGNARRKGDDLEKEAMYSPVTDFYCPSFAGIVLPFD